MSSEDLYDELASLVYRDFEAGRRRPAGHYRERLSRELPNLEEALALLHAELASSEGPASLADLSERLRADLEQGGLKPLAAYVGDLDETSMKAPIGPGSLIGRYRLMDIVGRGGQGQVWRARDEDLGRIVAIKVLLSYQAPSASSQRRFEREAEVLSALDHPGICTVFESGIDSNIRYLAMRFIDGMPLDERIAQSREERGGDGSLWIELDEVETSRDTSSTKNASAAGSSTRARIDELIGFVEKVARALHVAHEAGLVHRDIKPGNLICGRDGQPVILDFGLAQRIDDGPALTLSGDVLGTPAYMSPEQVAGRSHQVDRRSDIYSLGATLYECLTLHRPFSGVTREKLYDAILNEDPNPLRRHDARLPADLEIVCATAMSKEPERRYASALDFAEELRRIRELEPIRARPASLALRTRRWCQRNPRVAVLGVLLLLTISSALAWSLHQNRQLDEQRALAVVERDAARRAGYRSSLAAAEARLMSDMGEEAMAFLERTAPEYRGWEWDHLARRCDGRLFSLAGVRSVSPIEESPGRCLLLWPGGRVEDYDLENQEVLAHWETGIDAMELSSSPDGRYVLLNGVPDLDYESPDQRCSLYDLSANRLLRGWDFRSRSLVSPFSEDGQLVLVHNSAMQVEDIATGARLYESPRHLNQAIFLQDRRLAIVERRRLRIVELESPNRRVYEDSMTVNHASLSAGRRYLCLQRVDPLEARQQDVIDLESLQPVTGIPTIGNLLWLPDSGTAIRSTPPVR